MVTCVVFLMTVTLRDQQEKVGIQHTFRMPMAIRYAVAVATLQSKNDAGQEN